METATTERPSRTHLQDGRDELNLAEFPISVLSQQQQVARKQGTKLDSITYTASCYDPDRRERVPQTVTITAPTKYGLPTPAEEDVVLGLLHVAKHTTDFKRPQVHFVPHQLLCLIGWANNGDSYRRLEQALDRLTTVNIKYENAWWEPEGRKYRRVFSTGIVAEYELVHQVRGPRKNVQPKSFVTWRPKFYDALANGSIKRLDLDAYFSLKLPTSRRIYRYLDKRFYSAGVLTFDLRDFACGNVGLTAVDNVAELKRRLGPAIKELGNQGFIEPLPQQERYSKIKKGQWKITFSKPRPLTSQISSHEPGGLAQQLIACGVTAKNARRLAAEHHAEHVAEKLEVFHWLIAKNDSRIAISPAGYLVKSIEDRYQAPKGFKTKSQQEEEAKQIRVRKHAAHEQQQLDEQKRQQEHNDRKQLFTTWKPIWDQLSKQEQEDIRTAAIGDNAFLSAARRRNSDLVLEQCFKELARRHSEQVAKA